MAPALAGHPALLITVQPAWETKESPKKGRAQTRLTQRLKPLRHDGGKIENKARALRWITKQRTVSK